MALSSQYYRATLYSAQSIVWQQKQIIRSGLMFEGWYFKARQNLLQKMQDNLDKNNPLFCYTLSDNSSSEAWHDNMNHGPFDGTAGVIFDTNVALISMSPQM